MRQALGESFGNRLLYLAAPYSSPEPGLTALRLEATNRAAGQLIAQGGRVYSPLTGSATLERRGCRPPEGNWYTFDRDFLRVCDSLPLLLTGWRDSRGMRLELEAAADQGIPVCWLPLRCPELPPECSGD